MKRILTLCYDCAETYKAGFSVKPYKMARATTQPKKECEACRKKSRALEMYIVDKKGK